MLRRGRLYHAGEVYNSFEDLESCAKNNNDNHNSEAKWVQIHLFVTLLQVDIIISSAALLHELSYTVQSMSEYFGY